MAGVTAGVAVAMFEHHVRIPQTLAALLIALLLQIGSNLATTSLTTNAVLMPPVHTVPRV